MSRATFGTGLVSSGYEFTPTVNNNEAYSVVYPRIRPNQGAKGVIFAIHGAAGGARQGGSGGYWESLITYLADRHGYIVLAGDFGSNGAQGGASVTNPDTWGNQIAMAAMDAAFKWATQGVSSGASATFGAASLTDTTQNWNVNQWTGHVVTAGGKTGYVASNTATVMTLAANWTGGTPSGGSTYQVTQHFSDRMPYGKTTKVILLDVSMGGWIAKNWASRNTSKVACIVDVAGVVDDVIIYSGFGSQVDLAYGPKAPPSAPTNPTGTAGATAYLYKTVEVGGTVASPFDGPPSAATGSVNLVVRASLGVSPNTLAGITHNAFNSSSFPTIGTKILRSVSGGAYGVSDTVGQTALTTATGTGATTTLTVAPLPYGIPNGCVLQLSHPAAIESRADAPLTDAGVVTTQNVTVSSAAAANATSISVTSFTPTSGGVTAGWAVGTKVKVVTYIDRVTATESAYTQIAAAGSSRTTGAYGVNGRNVNPSFDPVAATNLTAGLKAIPLQYWWSANDGSTSTGSGVPGVVNTEVNAYKTAYGANMTLQEIPTDPAHSGVLTAINASSASQAAIASFINANAP